MGNGNGIGFWIYIFAKANNTISSFGREWWTAQEIGRMIWNGFQLIQINGLTISFISFNTAPRKTVEDACLNASTLYIYLFLLLCAERYTGPGMCMRANEYIAGGVCQILWSLHARISYASRQTVFNKKMD